MSTTANNATARPHFCGPKKIALVLGVSDPTPINWFNGGKLAGVKIGSCIRFPIEETAKKLGINPELLM